MIPALVEIPALPPHGDVWEWIETLCPSTPEPTDRASDMDWRTIEAAAGMDHDSHDSADQGAAGRH